MKAILISIRPQWVELILNGIKKDEIRKGTAIGKAINKLIAEQGVAPTFIYCTKNGGNFAYSKGNSALGFNDGNKFWEQCRVNGKVVARFNATAEEIKRNGIGYYYCDKYIVPYGLQKWSCLTQEKLEQYLQGKSGTVIHITNLEIFDKPKEIAFMRPQPIWKTSNQHYYKSYQITHAPQSWCYVEI